MVSLRLFAIILISLICQQIAGDQPWTEWRNSFLATIGISLGFGLLVKSFALSAFSRGTVDSTERLDRYQKYRRTAELAWCFFLPAALLATGWASWLKALELEGLPHAMATLGCFMPAFLFVILVELTSAQVDELQEEAETGQSTNWRSHFLLRLRLGDLAGLLTCITPVLLISLFSDLSSYLSTEDALLAIDSRLATPAAAGVILLLFLLVFPVALSRWSGARAIEATDLESRIQDQLRKLGLRGVQTLIVHSHGRWMGAAIVGWFPYFRKLWLSDGLVASLDQRELDMVVLHELAHVDRRHFLWRTLPVMVTAAISIAIWGGLQQVMLPEALLVVLQMLVLCTGGFMIVITLGTVARFCELDADRRACEMARKCCYWAQTDSPNAILGSVLADKILIDSDAAKATWLHPSLAERLHNLKASEEVEQVEACRLT